MNAIKRRNGYAVEADKDIANFCKTTIPCSGYLSVKEKESWIFVKRRTMTLLFIQNIVHQLNTEG